MNRFVAYVAALAALVLFLLSGCGATVPKHVPMSPPCACGVTRTPYALVRDDGGEVLR